VTSNQATSNTQENNVPHSWEHTHITVCSQNNETFSTIAVPQNSYTKGSAVIYENGAGVYSYNGDEFRIDDGCLTSSFLTMVLPRRSDISTIERILLSLGMSISNDDVDTVLDLTAVPFKEVLQALTALALKDLSIVSNVFTQHNQIKYGEVVFNAFYKSVSGSGKISSKDKDIRWLNEEDTLSLKCKLFTISGYQANSNSMKYQPTPYALEVFRRVFDLLGAVEFKDHEIPLGVLDFTVKRESLGDIKLRDVMLLLGNCISYRDGFIIRPTLTDNQFSRVYSVFTSIGSQTRKSLGFTNYDIGSAMQTICLQLVEDSSLYPLHEELMNDKYAFRQKIADETGKDMAWVKKELSSADNKEGIQKAYESSPTLMQYFKEAIPLRREIIDKAEPLILSRAKEFAKVKWRKDWNKQHNQYEYHADGKKESSIFFFIWTQWERHIRDSMMCCFAKPQECHQVHDAVYSKEDIEPSLIEARVLNETGFKVRISKD